MMYRGDVVPKDVNAAVAVSTRERRSNDAPAELRIAPECSPLSAAPRAFSLPLSINRPSRPSVPSSSSTGQMHTPRAHSADARTPAVGLSTASRGICCSCIHVIFARSPSLSLGRCPTGFKVSRTSLTWTCLRASIAQQPLSGVDADARAPVSLSVSSLSAVSTTSRRPSSRAVTSPRSSAPSA